MSEKNNDALEFDVEAFEAFANELRNETDRSVVILGTARLDQLLHKLLHVAFVPIRVGGDRLLEHEGPLSTFSGKWQVAFRVGLISEEFARALAIIGRIRNKFTHESTPMSLDDVAFRDQVAQLAAPLLPDKRFVELIAGFSNLPPGAKQDFRAAISLMCVDLEVFIARAPTFSSASALCVSTQQGEPSND